MNTSLVCTHCALPVGRFAQQREVAGEPCVFCCYGCCLAYQVHRGAGDEHDAATALIRLGVGAFLAMNIMLFSLLLYAGAFSGVDAWLRMPVTVLLWILATPLIVMLGAPFFVAAAGALRAGRLTTDTLVSIGVLAAYSYSALQVLRGSELVYFDATSLVLVLFTLGRYLEAQGRARAARSLAPMLAAERAEVRVVAENEVWSAATAGPKQPLRNVVPGMQIRVAPGERIAVDGIVLAGRSDADESILRGRTQPRAKSAGDVVLAGSLNGAGALLIRATSAGTETRWIRISRLVRDALARKSMTAETVDRVVGVFVPCVVLLALSSAWYWNERAGTDAALLAALAVLVVACPCALGLAAPLANALALAAAAQRGILIRGGAVLERLARVKVVAFDKTGTLTRGELQPRALFTHRATETEVLRHACALAATSTHPVARAVASMRSGAADNAQVDAIEEFTGKGVAARINSVMAGLGSAAWMEELGWDVPVSLERNTTERATHVLVGWAKTVYGCITFDDAPIADASVTIRELHERGLTTAVLSGDSAPMVARLAADLGVGKWRAQLLPEDKTQALRSFSDATGATAMVGDGLNDGPVLAAASVGIAVGNASDLAKESADVVLPPGSLATLPWLFDLARHTQRSIRANLAWAFGYNLIALSLAAAGLLQPVFAAALMAGSSILVVARSWRAAGRHQRAATEDRNSPAAAPGQQRWA